MPARNENPKKPQELSVSHVRRCHVCGTVNEAEGSAIVKCSKCRKHLAPFYFFEESKLEGLADNGLYMSQVKSSATTVPIWGLSTYWVGVKDESHTGRNKKGA
ncbi:MAG: hypothetical protein BroJett040_25190 [Oligoflexia bacterium]|nr:MAG: hypothetical protein BroJett040_25190 [Oligoflexia bacterium]